MTKDTFRSAALTALAERHIKFSEETFLRYVAEGRQEIAKLFLDAGIDPNAKNTQDEPAIVVAAKNGHDTVVTLLSDQGAKLQGIVKYCQSAKSQSSWDKTAATISPYVSTVATFAVALTGIYFTCAYQRAQLQLQRMQVFGQALPGLSDPKQRTASLIVMNAIDQEIGGKIISAMQGPAAAEAAVQIVSSGLVPETRLKAFENSTTPLLDGAKQDAIREARSFLKADPSLTYNYGGKSPKEGFDPGGFVAYVFSKAGLIPQETYKNFNSTALQRRYKMQSSDTDLAPGDLIFYESGNCMIYEGETRIEGEDKTQKRMIGMLSTGLKELPLQDVIDDSGPHKRLGYGRVGFVQRGS